MPAKRLVVATYVQYIALAIGALVLVVGGVAMSLRAGVDVIGLDGRSGSGKTVLAAALAARIAPFARVEVIEIESMYRGWDGLAAAVGDDGPYPAAVRALRERGTATWTTWDWHRAAPGPPRRTAPADVVVCEWAGPNAVWYARHKRPGQRLVVRLHMFELRGGWLSALETEAVDRLVTVSDLYRDLVREHLGVRL